MAGRMKALLTQRHQGNQDPQHGAYCRGQEDRRVAQRSREQPGKRAGDAVGDILKRGIAAKRRSPYLRRYPLHDLDAQRRTMNEIDDYLYDEVKGARGIALSTEEMDEIIEKTMQLARHRMAG